MTETRLSDPHLESLRGMAVSRFLALRVGECLTMLVLYEQRHLQQAERVGQEPAFPRN
jgi:hypothetical protein